jgi:hypothetical protein
VQGEFSAGALSSDGGALLVRQVDQGLGVTRALARCFDDRRAPRFVDHSVEELLRQRLMGLALGYEDLNDHARLRHDPLLAVACEKHDPLGRTRLHDQTAALAAPATLNRLELSNNKRTRGHKVPHDPAKVEACLLTMAVRCLPKHAREIVLDLDSMGHLVHGLQEGRHFHAYYGDYCYRPLYVVAGDVVLWAQLRTSDGGDADGVVAALEKVVTAVRQRCRKARIIVRGDSGFSRDDVLSWCEAHAAYYCLGLQKNEVLVARLEPALARARAQRQRTSAAKVRQFAGFQYRTRRSWSRARRVVGKAEVMAQGDNPRFVVTNLPARGWPGRKERKRFGPRRLYEEVYCARGQMENVLKQQVLDLQADRLSTHHLASNQLRLWLAAFAYLLLERVRALGCRGTELARATVGTIRLRLLKVAAEVTVSVRRVLVRFSGAYPMQALFRHCQRQLLQGGAPAG